METVLNSFIAATAFNLLYAALYIASLCYIVKCRDKIASQTLVLPMAFMMLIMFNPVTYYVVKNVPSVFGIYGRFFWLCTVFIVDAIALAYVIAHQQKVYMSILAGIFCVGLIVSGGGTQMHYIESENIYKIPQYVIDMDEAITVAKRDETPTIISCEEIFFYIRQYDPSIMSYGNFGFLADTLKEEMGEEICSGYGEMYEFLTGAYGYEVQVTADEVDEFISALGIDFVGAKTDRLAELELQDYSIECIYADDGRYIFQIIKR